MVSNDVLGLHSVNDNRCCWARGRVSSLPFSVASSVKVSSAARCQLHAMCGCGCVCVCLCVYTDLKCWSGTFVFGLLSICIRLKVWKSFCSLEPCMLWHWAIVVLNVERNTVGVCVWPESALIAAASPCVWCRGRTQVTLTIAGPDSRKPNSVRQSFCD